MPAYLFGNIEVTNPQIYEEYRAKVPATIAAFGGRFLVRGGATEILEGSLPIKRVVILEFADMAKLKAWYHSPEYQEILQLREDSTRSELVAIEGLERP